MHLHIDCQFGIAGDMLLAALIDAGADADVIEKTLASIPLEGFRLHHKRGMRSGISAMFVDVEDNTHAHEHHDEQTHAHTHAHGHDHQHGHDHGPHRHLSDLLALLESDVIPPRVKERAAKVFRIIGQAEATVHGESIDHVHFHEISGIDTAVDVIGSCLALEMLGIDSITASAPSVGSGMIACAHGLFPVPAPATLEILKTNNMPWRSGGEGERATPTGIGLLAGLVSEFGASPEITVARIGYGAGQRDYQDAPNLVRVIIGKQGSAHTEQSMTTGSIVPVNDMLPAVEMKNATLEGGPENDRVAEFRFAVDDMTAESLAYLFEKCFEAGALDAYAISAVMKKSRPGHEVTILARPATAPLIADIIWRESTTFGMRVSELPRLVLEREMRSVNVSGQKIGIKLGWLAGKIVRRQPEYEDCRRAAAALGRPLSEIMLLASREAAALR